MKKTALIIALCCAVFAGCKKGSPKNAIVYRDCTGTYLRITGKDYQVCNLEKVAPFRDGAAVTASFKNIATCNGSAKDAIVCMMLHANEGWIEVTDIK